MLLLESSEDVKSKSSSLATMVRLLLDVGVVVVVVECSSLFGMLVLTSPQSTNVLLRF